MTTGVTLDRVDRTFRWVTVDRQLITVKGGVRFGPPKTAKSNRKVPLPDFVLRALDEHLERWPVGDDGLVFTNNGTPWRRGRLAEVFRAAVKKAGLPEGTSSHDLRHHCASVLVQGRASVKMVQEHLGHSSAVETLNVYSHLMPEAEGLARDVIEARWGSPIGLRMVSAGSETIRRTP